MLTERTGESITRKEKKIELRCKATEKDISVSVSEKGQEYN